MREAIKQYNLTRDIEDNKPWTKLSIEEHYGPNSKEAIASFIAHPEKQEEKIVLEQQQEEDKAHKKEELYIEEEPGWYHNYMMMFVTHLSVPQEEKTIAKTTNQEDEEAKSYKQNFNVRNSNKMVGVDQSSGRSISRTPDDSEPYLEPESTPHPQKALKNLKLKKLYSNLEFLLKERNLT